MNTPARLDKKVSWGEKVEVWAIAHAYILMPVSIIILLLLFVGLCFAICGVSAVESGGMRNFIAGGV